MQHAPQQVGAAVWVHDSLVERGCHSHSHAQRRRLCSLPLCGGRADHLQHRLVSEHVTNCLGGGGKGGHKTGQWAHHTGSSYSINSVHCTTNASALSRRRALAGQQCSHEGGSRKLTCLWNTTASHMWTLNSGETAQACMHLPHQRTPVPAGSGCRPAHSQPQISCTAASRKQEAASRKQHAISHPEEEPHKLYLLCIILRLPNMSCKLPPRARALPAAGAPASPR